MDKSLLSDIEKLLRDHVSEMDTNVLHNYRKTHSGNTENLQGLDMNDDTKSLVAKEIRGFRETYNKVYTYFLLAVFFLTWVFLYCQFCKKVVKITLV